MDYQTSSVCHNTLLPADALGHAYSKLSALIIFTAMVFFLSNAIELLVYRMARSNLAFLWESVYLKVTPRPLECGLTDAPFSTWHEANSLNDSQVSFEI